MKASIIKAENNIITAGPRVIAVTSGKGGVGKTNITVNLALALADLDQRVVIFDADLGLANAEVLLGLAPRYSIYDFLYNQKSLMDILTPGPNQVNLISGGSGLWELANLDIEVIDYLREAVHDFEIGTDWVLVDTGAGLNKNVLAFVAAASEVITVVTPEPTAIVDAYGIIKVLARYDVHDKINIIVNKVLNQQESDDTMRKLQVTAAHFLPNVKLNHLGTIPEDAKLVQAVKAQQPVVLFKPDSLASKAIKSIANRLTGVKTLEQQRAVTGQSGSVDNQTGIAGFFSRLTKLFS